MHRKHLTLYYYPKITVLYEKRNKSLKHSCNKYTKTSLITYVLFSFNIEHGKDYNHLFLWIKVNSLWKLRGKGDNKFRKSTKAK